MEYGIPSSRKRLSAAKLAEKINQYVLEHHNAAADVERLNKSLANLRQNVSDEEKNVAAVRERLPGIAVFESLRLENTPHNVIRDVYAAVENLNAAVWAQKRTLSAIKHYAAQLDVAEATKAAAWEKLQTVLRKYKEA